MTNNIFAQQVTNLIRVLRE